ncbi:MAG: CBS domain-containing protein, partial [Deltaproteobacteria bacterium]|nr:CBS domain-containing protein [Deltaproteobacteria bacterium]
MGLIKKLHDSEPFKFLPEETVEEFNRAAIIQKFPARTHIFNQHDRPSGYLYIIKQGEVEIVALTPGGVEMVVNRRREGEFFGGTPVFTNEEYTAGARTVTATECYLIPQELLTKAARLYPQITEYFTRTVHTQLRNLYTSIVREHSSNISTRMEAYPFQKRLAEIMSSPVQTCPLTATAQEIGRQMLETAVGSVLVVNDQAEPVGIITEKDLVAKIISPPDNDYRTAVASDLMSPQLDIMSVDNYMYEAMAHLESRRTKYLPVMAQGKLVGIVTRRDLLRYRSQKAMLLITRIKKAGSVEELISARQGIVKIAKVLMSEARSTIETMEILSYIHHCILQRGYELVLDELRQQGLTPPDIRFCFIIMGSGGRKEMLLSPDQDNGFIYEDFADDKIPAVDAFFLPFAEKLVEAYDRIGYPRCKGKVMVNNPLWRGRLQEWRARIADWINAPEPQKVRYSTIFFDFMPLVGDPSLCRDLSDIVHLQIRKFPLFLYHMMELDFQHKVPLGLLGRFILDKEVKGKLSTKQTGSIFIVDCIRMFLLEKQVEATTTCERLDQLVKLKVFNADTAEHIKAAYEAFTYLRLRNEITLIDAGQAPSHYLDP